MNTNFFSTFKVLSSLIVFGVFFTIGVMPLMLRFHQIDYYFSNVNDDSAYFIQDGLSLTDTYKKGGPTALLKEFFVDHRGFKPVLLPLIYPFIAIGVNYNHLLATVIINTSLIFVFALYVFLLARLFIALIPSALVMTSVLYLPWIYGAFSTLATESFFIAFTFGAIYHFFKSESLMNQKHSTGFFIFCFLCFTVRPLESFFWFLPILVWGILTHYNKGQISKKHISIIFIAPSLVISIFSIIYIKDLSYFFHSYSRPIAFINMLAVIILVICRKRMPIFPWGVTLVSTLVFMFYIPISHNLMAWMIDCTVGLSKSGGGRRAEFDLIKDLASFKNYMGWPSVLGISSMILYLFNVKNNFFGYGKTKRVLILAPILLMTLSVFSQNNDLRYFYANFTLFYLSFLVPIFFFCQKLTSSGLRIFGLALISSAFLFVLNYQKRHLTDPSFISREWLGYSILIAPLNKFSELEPFVDQIAATGVAGRVSILETPKICLQYRLISRIRAELYAHSKSYNLKFSHFNDCFRNYQMSDHNQPPAFIIYGPINIPEQDKSDSQGKLLEQMKSCKEQSIPCIASNPLKILSLHNPMETLLFEFYRVQSKSK